LPRTLCMLGMPSTAELHIFPASLPFL
jgi:hypothetical protein